VLPRNYAGGGITAYIHYSMATATTGTIVWSGAWERIGDEQQDVDSDSFATAQAATATGVPATSGNVDILSIPFTDGAQIDSLAVGEGFRFRVSRVATATGDTVTGDAELHWVEIKET
jgi:hypothetical protein